MAIRPSTMRGSRCARPRWPGAHAYLTGTVDELAALQGPECLAPTTTSLDRRAAVRELQQARDGFLRLYGVPTGSIRIRGVRERNVTRTSGEAEVLYDLPVSMAGNDNWVTYELHGGRWKVADCHLPIGGHSSSTGFAPATTSR